MANPPNTKLTTGHGPDLASAEGGAIRHRVPNPIFDVRVVDPPNTKPQATDLISQVLKGAPGAKTEDFILKVPGFDEFFIPGARHVTHPSNSGDLVVI